MIAKVLNLCFFCCCFIVHETSVFECFMVCGAILLFDLRRSVKINIYFWCKIGNTFLTLKLPIKTAADDKFMNFFLLLEKIRYDIS